jgi:hypothetical protein
MIAAKLYLQIFVIIVVMIWMFNKSGKEIYKTFAIQRTRKGVLRLNWTAESFKQKIKLVKIFNKLK